MIERELTPQERKDFEPIGEKDPAQRVFYNELTNQEQSASKKKLPFASKVAIDDFKEEHERQYRASLKKNGGFVLSSDFKPIKLDWNKYSDLKNFEVISETEVSDSQLAKNNPGLTVKLSCKTYKFKGYDMDTYSVMEDPEEAVSRAIKKRDNQEKDIRRK